jgi:hypothetical protein
VKFLTTDKNVVLKLEPAQNRRLMSYLVSSSAGANYRYHIATGRYAFDCVSLVAYLSNAPTRGLWKLKSPNPLDDDQGIPSGAIVLLVDRTIHDWQHFAVSLGSGLFLSKFGPHYGLFVTTLAALHETYGTNVAWHVEPARSQEEALDLK